MEPSVIIPDAFVWRITSSFKEPGAAWLEELPVLVAECARRWLLTVEPPFSPLSYNYVAPATRADGTPVVLKLGVPHRELASEIESLRLFDGRGAVRLLDADPARGLLLLERLSPGTTLVPLVPDEDERATIIAAGVMRGLWRPAPEDAAPFPTVAGWAADLERLRTRFAGGTGPLPASLVERAEAIFAERIAAAESPPVLMHGDLHHENILAAERAPWLAIDPKGLVGDPAFEVYALLRNPMPGFASLPNAARLLERRVHILADELGFDRTRVRDWGFAGIVLSAWWSVEDHEAGWEPAIACAELLAAIKV